MRKTILLAGIFTPMIFLAFKFQDKNLQESMKRGKVVYMIYCREKSFSSTVMKLLPSYL
jgi:hypothetical protein